MNGHELQAAFGGKVFENVAGLTRQGSRLEMTSATARLFLHAVLPYLRVKREHVESLLERDAELVTPRAPYRKRVG